MKLKKLKIQYELNNESANQALTEQPVCLPENDKQIEFNNFDLGDDCDYELKKILVHKFNLQRRLHYKVQYKNFQADHTVWFFADEINAPDFIEFYKQNHNITPPLPQPQAAAATLTNTFPTQPQLNFSAWGRRL